jgi:uncharacterized protein (TIGR03435 family)
LDWDRASLRGVLVTAFKVGQSSPPLSVPDWVADVVVDIHATIPAGAREHVPEMLKTLLITRFGLRAHIEPRPTDVYELVVGNGRGVLMQEVQAVNELDKEFPSDPSRKPPVFDKAVDSVEGRFRSIVTEKSLKIVTDRSMYEQIRTDRGTEEIDATRITMAQFASILSFVVGRPVIDGTRLPGLYHFRIELPFPTFGLIASPYSLRATDATPPDAPTGVSAFKAVEKLGLKLESRRSPIDTIVVDNIDRVPTEN